MVPRASWSRVVLRARASSICDTLTALAEVSAAWAGGPVMTLAASAITAHPVPILIDCLL
jgi:hypothetical protein